MWSSSTRSYAMATGRTTMFEMAPVIRRVDDAVLPCRVERVAHLLGDFFDFAQDRIHRVLQRAIHVVPLRGAKLFEIAVDFLAAISVSKILDDFLVSEDRLRHF